MMLRAQVPMSNNARKKAKTTNISMQLAGEKDSDRVVWSLFSGAMGLDIGLTKAGLAPSLAIDNDPACEATARANPWLHAKYVKADIRNLTASDIRRLGNHEGEIFLLVGGPPCQAFSPGGNREGLKDPRGNLIYEYFRIVQDIRPKFFVFENVANLATAALSHRPIDQRPGKHWSLRTYEKDRGVTLDSTIVPMRDEELAGSALRHLLSEIANLKYRIIFGVLDAADYGACQHRLRFVMIGARDGLPPRLPTPTHGNGPGLPPLTTLRDTIWDIQDNPGPYYNYTPKFAELFRQVPPGGYWKDLPKELHREALGNAYDSGGGKTGFFRRLSWDSPAPTVTGKPNRKGSAMCHPEAVRSLSVKECGRIQGFPDNWIIAGSTDAQFRQIGNAVPVHLGEAIGRCLLSGELATDGELDPEVMLQNAIKRLRASGRNKASKKKQAEARTSLQTQTELWTE